MKSPEIQKETAKDSAQQVLDKHNFLGTFCSKLIPTPLIHKTKDRLHRFGLILSKINRILLCSDGNFFSSHLVQEIGQGTETFD